MEETLSAIGLTDGETSVYISLLTTPRQTAQQIASQTHIGRTNVYRIIESLENQNLIIADNSAVKKFEASNPHTLKEIVRQKQLDLKRATESLVSILPSMTSRYALGLDKPGVLHLPGDEGFLQAVSDAVRSKTDILLIASDHTPTDEATLNRFRELLIERKNANVHTRALFHGGDHQQRIKHIFQERGIELRFLGETAFEGEVSIYEDNVVFTVYRPSLVTTIITNTQIASTMRLLFEQLWARSE